MKTNMHKLACALAKRDNPVGYNADVIAAETTLKALREYLDKANPIESIAILFALAPPAMFVVGIVVPTIIFVLAKAFL